MHDVEDDPETKSYYECLACGEIVSAETRPSECPECPEIGTLQNRTNSLE